MFYYLVWVRSNRYHSKELLTYSSTANLNPGALVRVELQQALVNGFIVRKVPKPSFKTKEIETLYSLPPLPPRILSLADWMKEYYPAPIGIIAQQFLPASLTPSFKLPDNKKLPQPSVASLPKLNDQQEEAVRTIKESGTYLLHGRTGTGKTRVYIELAMEAIKTGQSVIVLSPEIGLSSQLYSNFSTVFKDGVIAIHSKQTPKERLSAWLRCITSDQPLVVIGPRSALFSPLKNVGLIVLDEAHDSAYKQEQLPHYLATRTASALASFSKSKLVLGSATPSVNDYLLAEAKKRPIISMTKLAKGPAAKSIIDLIDLKDRSAFGLSYMLSDQLIETMKLSLSKKEQSLLFLNRRGTSRLILCERCGWEAVCPNCNLPLIYHGDLHQLRCHTCGYLEKVLPTVCPNCGSDSILYTTVGTKAVVEEVKRFFPSAVIKRFDTDNKKAESLAQLYQSVLAGEVDILIGTQQLAKGFDLPKLTTVGILQADTNLYIPDYTSEEHSFQLITQVLGRISRGHLSGHAVIQTYNPSSKLLKAAIEQDYDTFYKNEVKNREKFKFPPFYSLLKLTCTRATARSAEAACLKLKQQIEKLNAVKIEGPAPSFHEKRNGKYQWQLVVKATNRKNLLAVIELLPSGWSYDIDPTNLL